ncbi:MAG: cytochrome C oxidase subunit IV family protein [Novosphingobium sp.]|nr:cytochrome C oxidase subunit IV family protein [Novosphingobium sp.]
MLRLLRDPLFLAWSLLVAVTLVSSRIGGPNPGIDVGSAAAVTTIVLSIAFAKVAVVIFTFMEVRGAPVVLRVLCSVWLFGVLGALLALYYGILP